MLLATNSVDKVFGALPFLIERRRTTRPRSYPSTFIKVSTLNRCVDILYHVEHTLGLSCGVEVHGRRHALSTKLSAHSCSEGQSTSILLKTLVWNVSMPLVHNRCRFMDGKRIKSHFLAKLCFMRAALGRSRISMRMTSIGDVLPIVSLGL